MYLADKFRVSFVGIARAMAVDRLVLGQRERETEVEF